MKYPMIINVTCPFCEAVSHVEVELTDYNRWKDGTLVQDAFPYLSADERTLLLTGICTSCWDNNLGDC